MNTRAQASGHDNADPDPVEQRFQSAPGFFPTANVPVWVTMHPDVDAQSLAVAQFIVAYRNSADGSLPHVGRSTIMRRFSCKKTWLDNRTAALERIGFLSKIPMYIDAHTGERTPDSLASDGTSNRQTSNDWLLHDQPPAGDFHPHPIQSSEFDRPDRVHGRIERRARVLASVHRGGGRTHGPGTDQEKQEFSQFDPGAAHTAPGGPHTRPRTKTKGTRTPNQPAPAAANDGAEVDVDGWLGATPNGETTGQASSTEGRRLLQEWGVAGRALDEWASVVDDAVAALGYQEARTALTGNLSGVNSPAGVIIGRRLPALRDRLSATKNAPTETGKQQTTGRPPWCGQCDEEDRRERRTDGGMGKRCPRCHPNPEPTKPANGRAQGKSDEAFLRQVDPTGQMLAGTDIA